MQHSTAAAKDEFSLLKEKPSAGFPSRHHWYIQAKRMNATAGLKLPEGATFVDDAAGPVPSPQA